MFTTRNQSSTHLSTGQHCSGKKKADDEMELLSKAADEIYKPVKLKYDPYIDTDDA